MMDWGSKVGELGRGGRDNRTESISLDKFPLKPPRKFPPKPPRKFPLKPPRKFPPKPPRKFPPKPPRNPGFNNWLVGEPNNGVDAGMAVLPMDGMVEGVETLGLWGDSPLTQSKFYICERSLCADQPCMNGGNCTVTNTTFVCECSDGYYGNRCENERDPCHPNPCANEGICITTEGNTTRGTTSGGTTSGGTTGGNTTCICEGRYEGKSCEIDKCDEHVCYNNGTCDVIDDSLVCDCPHGFKGRQCQIDLCEEKKCLNEATCEILEDGILCLCPAGYNGTHCENDLCEEKKCLNEATCQILEDGILCLCPAGYNGTHCEIDLCEGKNCLNGATCQILDDGILCLCPAGYNGTHCENDLCVPNPCYNNGYCAADTGVVTCECQPGFEGDNCQVDLCVDHCLNGGTCIPSLTPSCACSPSYTGTLCQEEILVVMPGEYFIHVDPARRGNFEDSRQHCMDSGGGLAIIKDDETQSAITAYLVGLYGGSTVVVWVGGWKVDGGWYWLDGSMVPTTDVGYSHWAHGQPTDEPNQCLSLQSSPEGFVWIGIDCGNELSYIREKSGESHDLCESFECKHEGNCSSSGAHVICSCATNWIGEHCEQNVNEETTLIIIVVASVLGISLVIIAIILVWRFSGVKKGQEQVWPMEKLEDLSEEPQCHGRTITADRILHVYHQLCRNDFAEFQREFNEMKEESGRWKLSSEVCKNTKNKPKNRFSNIFSDDNYRVKLKTDKENQTNYINAGYIEVNKNHHKFIATQAPLPNTLDDFWRMVWEQKCQIIVMLTNLVEKEKTKCEKYWPHKNSMKYHGDMQVATIDEIKQDCYIIRDMQISKHGQETRIVRQFHFLTWPDHGSPLTTSGFMRFYDIIKGTKTIHPIVVHCSAGVGRTGTFIAFDVVSDSMATTGIVDVYGTVVAMRRCRTEMVQSLDQYIYLYKLLVESTVLENRGFYASEIGQVMARLNTKNHIGKSLLQSEYEDLHLIEATNTKCIAANLANPKLNRDGTVLPYDHNAPILKYSEGAGYYNASVLEGSHGLGGRVVVAQSPTMTSLNEFWQVVWYYDITMIIMLTDLHENRKELCTRYWPMTSLHTMKCGPISIKIDHADYLRDKDSWRRGFTLIKGADVKEVTQLQFNGWGDEGNPPIYFTLLDWLAEIHLCRNNGGSVLVHCTDGAGRSGVLLSVANLLETIKNQNKIDVFRTVKDLRDMRPNMVKTQENYRFIYDTIATYIEMQS